MSERPTSPFSGLDKALLRSTRPPQETAPEPSPISTPPTDSAAPRAPRPSQRKNTSSSDSDTASKLASAPASTLATEGLDQTELVKRIRATVKTPGREVSFVRLTSGEKARLAELVYRYKRQGKKTTENEINRIAVNFILEDHEANGDRSVLAKVIDALLA